MERLFALLERLVIALEGIAGRPAATVSSPLVVSPPAQSEKATRRGRPPKEEKPEPTPEPAVEAAAEEGDEWDAPAAPPVEEKKYTKEDLRAALTTMQKRLDAKDPDNKPGITKGRKIMRDIGGVETMSAIPEDKYAAVIAACEKEGK